MEYNYEQLRISSPDDVRNIISSLFKRSTDTYILEILNQKESNIQCRNAKYIIKDDSISIGYYEGWDEDLHLIVIYKDRIEYHWNNKFHPVTTIKVLCENIKNKKQSATSADKILSMSQEDFDEFMKLPTTENSDSFLDYVANAFLENINYQQEQS